MNTKKKSVPAFVRKPEFVTIIILIVMIIVVAALLLCTVITSEYDHFLDTDHSSYNRTGSCNYFRWLGYVQW